MPRARQVRVVWQSEVILANPNGRGHPAARGAPAPEVPPSHSLIRADSPDNRIHWPGGRDSQIQNHGNRFA